MSTERIISSDDTRVLYEFPFTECQTLQFLPLLEAKAAIFGQHVPLNFRPLLPSYIGKSGCGKYLTVGRVFHSVHAEGELRFKVAAPEFRSAGSITYQGVSPSSNLRNFFSAEWQNSMARSLKTFRVFPIAIAKSVVPCDTRRPFQAGTDV